MRTIRCEFKTYIIHAFCDCGGRYVSSGITLTRYPPLYPHECADCGKKENFNENYPRTEYELKNELDYLIQVQNMKSNSPEKPDSCEQVGNSE